MRDVPPAANPAEAPAGPRSPRWAVLVGAALVALAALLPHASALGNGLVWDDVVLVRQNPWLEWPQVLSAFGHPFWGFTSGMGSRYYRPLVHVAFFLAQRLGGGAAWPFHLISLAAHLAACLSVFALCRRLAGQAAPVSVATVTAALFAVHPVHVEAIAWASGLADVAMAAFALGALVVGLRPDDGWGRRLGLFALALLAPLCKEPGAMVWLLVGAMELSATERPWRERVRRLSPAVLAAAVYVGLRTAALWEAPTTSHHTRLAGGWLSTALGLWVDYVTLALAPASTAAFHELEPSPWLSAHALGGLLSVVCLAFLAAAAWRKSRSAFWALALFVLPLLPALYVPALGVNAFCERYLYLPSAGLCLLLGLVLARFASRLGRRGHLGLAAAALVLATLGGWTSHARTLIWKSEVSLWEDATPKAPGSPVAWHNLGRAYLTEQRLGPAQQAFSNAVTVGPAHLSSWSNLAVVSAGLGDWPRARQAFERVSELRPNQPDVTRNLCLVYGRLSDDARVLATCPTAVAAYPESAELRLLWAAALGRAGRVDEARVQLGEAQRLSPLDMKAQEALERLPGGTDGH